MILRDSNAHLTINALQNDLQLFAPETKVTNMFFSSNKGDFPKLYFIIFKTIIG